MRKMALRRPDFFIVGAPRSGTTALFEHLGRHPGIFVPRVKEPIFFAADEAFGTPDRPRMTIDEYLRLFEAAGDAVRVGEASTTYLYCPSAAAEIRDFSPDARIIIMLRDPIAVMYAQHAGRVWVGQQPIRDFAAALEAQDRQRSGLEPPGPPGSLPYYRAIVDYATDVERYFDTFGRDRVHVILFDDWAADTVTEYRKTLEFLEVDPSFAPELGVVNANLRVRSERLLEVIADPPTTLRRVARPLPAPLRRRLRRVALRMNTRRAPREPLDPHLVERLRVELAPEIERLSKLLGRDLSAWTGAVEKTTASGVTRGDARVGIPSR